MTRHQKRPEEVPERPVTFKAAERLGAFELAKLWADGTAWSLDERTQYDELAELACMSALATWLRRWQPIAIHGAMLAGARPEAVAGALGNSVQVTFECWHEWASHQREFIMGGQLGISQDEYEAVANGFAEIGGVRSAEADPRYGPGGIGGALPVEGEGLGQPARAGEYRIAAEALTRRDGEVRLIRVV